MFVGKVLRLRLGLSHNPGVARQSGGEEVREVSTIFVSKKSFFNILVSVKEVSSALLLLFLEDDSSS